MREGGLGADACAPIRVLIVEDHRAVAGAFAAMLSRHDDMRVVGMAASIAEAKRVAFDEAPDVVLMDYHLPDGTGAEATAAIRRLHPKCQVIMLTGSAEPSGMLSAFEAGASGYLLKTQPAEDVVEAVRRAAAGEMLISIETVGVLLRQRRERERADAGRERVLASLTPREREVLGLMAQGLDNDEIAARLVVSLNTVRMHVQNVLDKLDAHSRLQAVIRASEYGIVTPGRERPSEGPVRS